MSIFLVMYKTQLTHGQHISATCDDPWVLEWMRHNTILVVTAGSTVCSGQQVGSIQSSHSQAEISSQSKPEVMDKKLINSTVINNQLILLTRGHEKEDTTQMTLDKRRINL